MYLYADYGIGQPSGVARPHAKSQGIRLLDVVVIGPLMVWGGAKLVALGSPVGGIALAAFGATTMGYNALNYARVAHGEAC